MNQYQVTCIEKPEHLNYHEAITHIGSAPSRWIWTKQEAVALIESYRATFFTIDPRTGKRADVHVVREQGKQPYLRTAADGYFNNNLLSLGACRIA